MGSSRSRSFLWSLVIASAIVGAVVLACSSPDPGEVIVRPRRDGGGGVAPTSLPDPDAGGGDSGPAPSAFGGAPPYNAAGTPNGDDSAKVHTAGHAFGTPPSPNPTGQNCMNCHAPPNTLDGGKTGGSVFLFGGTIADVAKKGVEVRMVNADTGKVVASTYTDVDGNFWAESPTNTALPAGKYKVGIRDGTTTTLMSTTDVKTGGCADPKCHVTGVQGPIKLKP